MDLSLDWDGPVAIRYARGASVCHELPRKPLVAGEAEVIFDEGKYAIVSAGHIFDEAYKFHQMLAEKGHKAKLINLRFINPLNMEALLGHLDVKAVYTFEENSRAGGVGEMLSCAVYERYKSTKVHIMSLPASFVTHGTVNELRQLVGLTAEHAMSVFEAELR